jgi:hypothetical protein
MKKNLALQIMFMIFINACAQPPLPTGTPTSTTIPHDQKTPLVTEASISGAPTVEPTLATLQLAIYPPETRTDNSDLDSIIDAILGHDFPTIKDLTAYLEIGCTTQDGLGGPPKCQEGELEGTAVEVVPFLGPEGHHSRKSDYTNWQGPDVLGLLAVYKNSPGTYSVPAYPAGEYSLVFLLGSGPEKIILQIQEGKIVRYDYHLGGLSPEDLEDKAEYIILPLTFNPIPTSVPWVIFQESDMNFTFKYPPTLELISYDSQGNWQLGNRIRVEELPFEASWISCFYQALGDCPFVETDKLVEINGLDVQRIEGYIGSVGGNVPQEFLVYIFPLEDQALVFSIFALPFGTLTSDPSIIWPLEGIDLELFERIVNTVVIE